MTQHSVGWRSGLAAILVMAAFSVAAEEYLARDDFLRLAFGDSEPEMQTLWLTEDTKAAARDTVGWIPRALRLRYWQAEGRTAWILEDIGKDRQEYSIMVRSKTRQEPHGQPLRLRSGLASCPSYSSP